MLLTHLRYVSLDGYAPIKVSLACSILKDSICMGKVKAKA